MNYDVIALIQTFEFMVKPDQQVVSLGPYILGLGNPSYTLGCLYSLDGMRKVYLSKSSDIETVTEGVCTFEDQNCTICQNTQL